MNKETKEDLKGIGRNVGNKALEEVTPILLDGFIGLMKRLFSKKARKAHQAAVRELQNRGLK